MNAIVIIVCADFLFDKRFLNLFELKFVKLIFIELIILDNNLICNKNLFKSKYTRKKK